MKLIVTMNQIGYFKPETTARRLKTYYCGEGDPVVFLGYLRLIRLLSELAERIAPLRPELYAKEVREIYLTTDWEERPYLVLFLREFREFFSATEWQALQQRYQVLYPFLAGLLLILASNRKKRHLAATVWASLPVLLTKARHRQQIRYRFG